MPSILRGRPFADAEASTPPRQGDAFPSSLAPEPPAIGDHVTDCRTGRRAEITAHLPGQRLAVADGTGTHWTLPAAEALR